MWKIISFVTIITLYTAGAGIVNCGPGVDPDRCPSNGTDSSPTRNRKFEYCKRPNRKNCPSPKCVCQFNHRRAENGACIPTIECHNCIQMCEPNEEYYPCLPYCPSDDCTASNT